MPAGGSFFFLFMYGSKCWLSKSISNTTNTPYHDRRIVAILADKSFLRPLLFGGLAGVVSWTMAAKSSFNLGDAGALLIGYTLKYATAPLMPGITRVLNAPGKLIRQLGGRSVAGPVLCRYRP